MQFINLVICILVLVTKTCFAGSIIETSTPDESSLIKAAINIVESCYGGRFSTVAMTGPSSDSIMAEMLSRDPAISVVLINKSAPIRPHFTALYRLQLFVATTTEQTSLWKTLDNFWSSIWWNHLASFLIIDLTEAEKGCSTAKDKLMEAWSYNLLNPTFLCLHPTRGLLIYTFNPYTSKAPTAWREEGTYEGYYSNGHPWTLFVREYREDESYCERLDFDKTVDLGGFEVVASTFGMERWWSANDSFRPDLGERVANVTVQFLISSLNATWRMKARPYNNDPLDQNQEYEIWDDIHRRASDIYFILCAQQDLVDYEKTYPVIETTVRFMTQYPGPRSQLDKIISVLDKRSRFGIFVVAMITLLYCKICLGKSLILSILDLVLLVCNVGIQREPQRTAPRIYLASLLMLVVTIQGIYSGEFASLLTKEVRGRTIDTMEDLARSNHRIYGWFWYDHLFDDEAFDGRYNVSPACTQTVINDPEAVCVATELDIISDADVNHLHLAREAIGIGYAVFPIRSDWPLQERVNENYRSAEAGGLLETLFSQERDNIERSLESYENHEQDPEVKVITLEDLGFAFVILGIGLGCATITFIIEVVIFRIANAKPRNRMRR